MAKRCSRESVVIHDCGRLRVREEPTGSRVIKTERNGSQTTWLTSSDQPVHSFMPWPSHALPKPRWGLYTLQIPLCMPWGGLHKAWIGGVKAGCDEVVEVARAHSASMPHPRSDALACFYQRSSRQTDVRAEQIKNHKHAKKYDRHLTNWGLFKHQRVFFFFLQRNAWMKRQVLTFEGWSDWTTVICRFDVELEVRWGKAGATESSAGASLTNVGQSSEQIGLMSRGERVKRRGGSSFNITRQYHSSGRGRDAGVRGWHLRTSERDPRDKSPAAELSGLVSDGRSGIFAHWDLSLISLYAASHWPLAECLLCVSGPRTFHFRLIWLTVTCLWCITEFQTKPVLVMFCFERQRRCKLKPIIRMSKGGLTLGLALLSPAKTRRPSLFPHPPFSPKCNCTGEVTFCNTRLT